LTTISIIKIIKIMTVLLLVSIIASSYNNIDIATATATATTTTLPQSVQEVLPLSDQSFGSTINLSNENSYDQQIAALGNKSYVVWTDETTGGNGDIYFKRSIDSGATFSNTTINLSNNTGSSENPQIAVSGNNVYVVWRDSIALEMLDILFTRSTDGGDTFSSPPINLSNNTGSSLDPQIAVSGSNVYVVWADQTTGDRDIYYIRSIDGGASFFTFKNLSENNTGRSDDPQIAVSGSNIYVVWTDLTTGDGDIYFIRSIDGGAGFFTYKNLSENNTGSSLDPQIAVSGSNVYVVWADQTTTTAGNRDIYFKRSTDDGAGFFAIKILSDNLGKSSRPPQPQIAVSENNVYVIWNDSSIASTPSTPLKDDIFLTKSTDGGATFSNTTINLSNENSDSPQIAVSGSNIYVVWTDKWTDNDETPGTSEILFKRSTDGGATFSSTINLSDNAGRSLDPQIAVSGSNIYVVWADKTTGDEDIYFKRSTNSGATFSSTPINLSNDTIWSSDPQIISSGNNIYVVWDTGTGTTGNYDILFTRSTNSGATFSNTPINLSNDTEYSSSPQIISSENNVYVVWHHYAAGNTDILFTRSTDGGATFSNTPINLSNDTGWSSSPQIISSENNVYVVWFDYAAGIADILFTRSTDGGATFSSTINLSNNAGRSEYPQIAVSGNNVYVVWFDYATGLTDIYFKRSTDGGATFSGSSNLSNNIGGAYSPQIAVSGNNVYVVWFDLTTENEEILFTRSTNSGATFSNTPINLSNNIGGSYSPQIAVSENNVYVVWLDYTTEKSDIFFKAGRVFFSLSVLPTM
jgi:hypothetical protein